MFKKDWKDKEGWPCWGRYGLELWVKLEVTKSHSRSVSIFLPAASSSGCTALSYF